VGAATSAPLEAADYGRWYLEALGQRMGRPAMVLPPEHLPTGWSMPE